MPVLEKGLVRQAKRVTSALVQPDEGCGSTAAPPEARIVQTEGEPKMEHTDEQAAFASGHEGDCQIDVSSHLPFPF